MQINILCTLNSLHSVWTELSWGLENMMSWSSERVLKRSGSAKADLMKRLSHIVLSVLVRLTDTVSKHNATKHNFEDNLCYNKKVKYTLNFFIFFYLSFHIVMWAR